MIDDKFLLLTIHPCVRGLGDEAVHEIADATQLSAREVSSRYRRSLVRLREKLAVAFGQIRIRE